MTAPMALAAGWTIFGGVVLLFGSLSSFIKQYALLSEAVVGLAVGVAIGPVGFGLFEPLRLPESQLVFREILRFALGVQLASTALRLEEAFLRHPGRIVKVLLLVVMPLMWLFSGLLAWAILGGSFWGAMLIGGVLAPTDPVLITTIVTGDFAERMLPQALRDALSAEAGANDGIAYPLVLLPALLVTRPAGSALGNFGLQVILRACLGGIAFGGAAGLLYGKFLKWSEAHQGVEKKSFLVFMVAFSLFILGCAHLIGVDDFLAVFLGACIFSVEVGGPGDAFREQAEHILDRFITIPVFIVFGMVLPWSAWGSLGGRGIGLVFAVLLVRRLPAAAMAKPLLRCSWADTLMLGWFGPCGIGGLFYAVLVARRFGLDVWPITSLIVFGSVIAYGFSAVPVTRLYARYRGGEALALRGS